MQTATNNTNNNQQYRTRINKYIRVPQVRLILSDGSNFGVVATSEALKKAQDEGLDLIEINPRAVPPVAKIADYGKMLYEEKKKQQAAKKNQTVQELKELNFRSNTDDNDINRLIERAKSFLEEGNKVKFGIKFRGREIAHADLGREKLEFVLQQLQGFISDKPQISLEGKLMWLIVSPAKQKA